MVLAVKTVSEGNAGKNWQGSFCSKVPLLQYASRSCSGAQPGLRWLVWQIYTILNWEIPYYCNRRTRSKLIPEDFRDGYAFKLAFIINLKVLEPNKTSR